MNAQREHSRGDARRRRPENARTLVRDEEYAERPELERELQERVQARGRRGHVFAQCSAGRMDADATFLPWRMRVHQYQEAGARLGGLVEAGDGAGEGARRE